MKLHPKITALTVATLICLGSARAADLAGKWKSEFDSQIGPQKYLFEFKLSGDRLVGRATGERQGNKFDTELKELKATPDGVSFVEIVKLDDQELRIEYKGKFTNDDELKLHRKVGDITEYDVTATRVKEK